MRTLSSLFVILVLTLDVAVAQPGLPSPTGRVNDFADVLDPSVELELDRLLDDLETRTSSEVAVAVVRSLDGMSVEEYANRLFRAWGIGQARQDNVVLVLVAPNEREIRIEVGYGLEGILPDGLAGEIIRDQFLPRFRENDYAGGVRAGVRRVVEIVERQQVLTPEELARFNESSQNQPSMWFVIPFLGLFVTIGFFMIGVGVRTKTGFPLLFGGMFGGMPMLMSMAFAGLLGLAVLIPLASLMALVGYRTAGRPAMRDAFRKSSGTDRGGWTMGAGSGGSGSSSGGSSSSFGGGSSGGGGASGRW